MFNGIDLSSDTATKPTKAMLNAMMNAEVGDEQKNEDPTTSALEYLVADRFGFSDAVFLPSATMANQIAIQCLCNPGDQLIAAHNSHLLQAECGGPSIHAKVMINPVFTSSGIFTSGDVKKQCDLIKNDEKYPSPKLVSVENTFNLSGGIVWNKKELNEIVDCAKEFNLKSHMDGSRIFNANVKTGFSVRDICDGFDTVTICLSKGLGCPVGALLVFNEIHKQKIRYLKKLMGGAMRQSGILAAAGIYALTYNIERLTEDHKNAAFLANELFRIPGIKVLNPVPDTNMVLFELNSPKMTTDEFHNKCIQKNVRFSQLRSNTLRAVTHLDISPGDIEYAVNVVKEITVY